MTHQRMDAYTKLAEASPFWAGALTSCIDQGLDEQGARELLGKCAQADSILEEELVDVAAHFKEADWYTPFRNAGRFTGGLFTSLAGGLGTAGAAIGAAGEGAVNMVTGRETNYSKDVMNDMMEYSRAGVDDMGTSLGMRGLAATHSGDWNTSANKKTRNLHEAKMEETPMTETEKAWARGIYDVSEELGNTAVTFAMPGTVFKALGGARAGYTAAKGGGAVARVFGAGKGLGQGTLQGVRAYAPVLAGGAPVFGRGAMTAGRAAFLGEKLTGATTRIGKAWQGTRNVFGTVNRFGARNALLPMAGVEGAAGYGGTIFGSTGIPQAASYVPYLSRIPAVARGVGMMPALPAFTAFEAVDQGLGMGGEALYRKFSPGHTTTPSAFSDLTGFAAYAAMPQKNRPLLPDPSLGEGINSEIKLPGAEVWTDAIKAGKDPAEAFKAALAEFQRIGGATPEPWVSPTYSRRSSSIANIIPGQMGKSLKNLYPDQSPPEIPLNDPALAADFTIPLNGIVTHQVVQLHKQEISTLLDNGLITSQQAAAVHTAYMQSPEALKATVTVRNQYLDALKERMHPTQHQSLLDAYRGQRTVPEVHIPPPAAPSNPPQRVNNPSAYSGSPVFSR